MTIETNSDDALLARIGDILPGKFNALHFDKRRLGVKGTGREACRAAG